MIKITSRLRKEKKKFTKRKYVYTYASSRKSANEIIRNVKKNHNKHNAYGNFTIKKVKNKKKYPYGIYFRKVKMHKATGHKKSKI